MFAEHGLQRTLNFANFHHFGRILMHLISAREESLPAPAAFLDRGETQESPEDSSPHSKIY